MPVEKTTIHDLGAAAISGCEAILCDLDGCLIAGDHVFPNARDFVEAHADRPLTAAELVQVSGVGTSALYEAFQRHRGCSPLAYLRRVRLERVRADLARPEAMETVTTVAMKWGFSHFGRFSGYYRQAFGESPSETLRRGRRRS